MIKVVYRYNADIWKNPYMVKKKNIGHGNCMIKRSIFAPEMIK